MKNDKTCLPKSVDTTNLITEPEQESCSLFEPDTKQNRRVLQSKLFIDLSFIDEC